jgi:hypothetical protein
VVQEASDNPKAGQALLPQAPYPIKKRLERLKLVARQKVLFPAIIDHGTRVGVSRERRDHIGGIKPVSTPIPHRINQVIIKILNFVTLAKLNPTATKSIGIIAAGLGF